MLLYTDLVSEIVADIAAKVPAFAHLQPERIAVAAAPRWAGSAWGNLAACLGLRADPEPTFSIWVRRRSREIVKVSPWYIRRTVEIHFNSTDCRYLILLRLPRLLEHNPLETIVHELYHIGEPFDGQLRPLRHGRLFDWNVQRLMREWLARTDPRLAELSQLQHGELRARHPGLLARRLPARFQPALVLPVEAPCGYEEGVARYYPGHKLARDVRIAKIMFTPPGIPRRITEGDCTFRNYHDSGSEEIAPYLARRLAARAPDLSRGDRSPAPDPIQPEYSVS